MDLINSVDLHALNNQIFNFEFLIHLDILIDS